MIDDATWYKMMLEERYAALLVQFTVSVIYSGGMPILWIIGFMGFLVGFIVDKWAFLRVYRLPPKYGPTLARMLRAALDESSRGGGAGNCEDHASRWTRARSSWPS